MAHRVIVIHHDADVVAAFARDLATSGFEPLCATDMRRVREWVSTGDIVAVLLDELLQRPSADELAVALRKAVGPQVPFLLLTTEVRELPAGSAFVAAMRPPLPRPVLADRLRRAIVAAASAGWTVDPMLLAEVEIGAGRIGRQNHYEVLGVGQKAPTDRIRDAYDRLALVFHPDRVRGIDDADLRDKVSTIYARIAEAWRVLRDGNERARYDRELQTGTRTTTRSGAVIGLEDFSTNPNTRKYLRLAQLAIAERNTTMALVHLRFAQGLEPENPFIAARIQELDGSAPR